MSSSANNGTGHARRTRTEDETRRTYNAIADEWHGRRSKGKGFFNEFLDMPNTLAVLGDIRGKSVLDVGCGTGLFARAMMRRVARVWGIDISEKEIEIAKGECRGADFRVGSASRLPYGSGRFDIVLIALAFTHFDDMDSALGEVRRVLRPHGRLVVSDSNPVVDATTRIDGRPRTYRRFHDYFEEGVTHRRWRHGRSSISMPVRHVTMETLMRLFIGHGFALRGYRDERPVKGGQTVDRASYGFTSRVPYFMVLDFVKLESRERRLLL